MTLLALGITFATCVLSQQVLPECLTQPTTTPAVASTVQSAPEFTGEALDVVLSAESVLAWDVTSGAVLYEKASTSQRPIASINKVLSALVIRDAKQLSEEVPITSSVRDAQRKGVDVGLPVGDFATVGDLLVAGLVASANDAMVALAENVAGTEEAFVDRANAYAASHGMQHTRVSNATGLDGGEQYSTAQDVRAMLMAAYQDDVLRDYMSRPKGTLRTSAGVTKSYTSTNQLLRSYVPIVIGKTGYTNRAKENVAFITLGPSGQEVGIVILGSQARFQDGKVLAEWLWRNYTWQ